MQPAHSRIAACLPETGLITDSRLRGMETRHVRKRSHGIEEVAIIKLRFPHKEPSIMQKGIVLATLVKLGFAG